MSEYVMLAAVGGNIPGIVADISGIIYKCGCNLEDSKMTLLKDHFTLMVLVRCNTAEAKEKLKTECRQLPQKDKQLEVSLFPLEEGVQAPVQEMSEPNYEIRVHGADQEGIVYRTTKLLTSRNINIVDLDVRIDRAQRCEQDMCTIRTSVVVPKEVDGEELRRDLEYLAEDLNEMISLSRLG
jgi:glycine cleavage system transcriptional repressor